MCPACRTNTVSFSVFLCHAPRTLFTWAGTGKAPNPLENISHMHLYTYIRAPIIMHTHQSPDLTPTPSAYVRVSYRCHLPVTWSLTYKLTICEYVVCVCVDVCVHAVFRDFAFVAGDKDSCVLKCHVFRCNAPAKAIATALHEMCSKVSEKYSNVLTPRRGHVCIASRCIRGNVKCFNRGKVNVSEGHTATTTACHVATCVDDVREECREAVPLSDHGKHLT